MKNKPLWYGGLALSVLAAVLLADKKRPHPGATRPNPKAPARTRQRIYVAARPERVWQVLSRLEEWPRWQPAIRAVRLRGPLRPGTLFDWKFSGTRMHSVLHTVVPQQALGWSGWATGSSAVQNWTLTPYPDGGTDVRVEESLEGWLGRLLRPAFQHRL
ncbi:MAG: SRPBCC family protein, partial [Hymenobacter sp.]|nr:SRPBCC family protein [Hymenobacter sp.]